MSNKFKILTGVSLFSLLSASAYAAGATVAPTNLPPCSILAQGATPPTGTPSGRFLRDDCTWDAPSSSGSVGLVLPNFLTVTGSPVSGSGTLTGTLSSQSANTVFAAPNGSSGSPTFRALVAADLPTGIPIANLTGTLQAAQEPAHTGDVLNTTGSLAMTLKTVAVTPGSYTNMNATVDANGRVIAASNGSNGNGTVNSGAANQIAVYPATGTTVSGASTLPAAVQSAITSLGTITSGVWNGTPITNLALANASTTVNGVSCVLGATCTVTAAAGTLTGLGTGVGTALGQPTNATGGLVTFSSTLFSVGQGLSSTTGTHTSTVPPGGTVFQQTLPTGPQSGTTYTILSSDVGNMPVFNGSSAAIWTVPTAGSAGFPNGASFSIQNAGTATITLASVSTLIAPLSGPVTIIPGNSISLTADTNTLATPFSWDIIGEQASNSGSSNFLITQFLTSGTLSLQTGDHVVRFMLEPQGGCGGGGGSLTAPFTGAGGGGGGGGQPKDTGWMPATQVSGSATITIATLCTAAAGGTSGGNGANGGAGANVTVAMTGLDVGSITAFGGGGGAGALGGTGSTGTGGGGGGGLGANTALGPGTIGAGNSSTSTTGGGSGINNLSNAGNGGSGASPNAGSTPSGGMGSGGGGGSSSTQGAGNANFVPAGSTGGGGGGECVTGSGDQGGRSTTPGNSNNINNAFVTNPGTSGSNGIPASGLGGLVGASGAPGGGSGTGGGGNGGNGGAGGGGGGGGGSDCSATGNGGNGGQGGIPRIIVMEQ